MTDANFVAAIVRQGHQILLVQQQWAADPQPYWALPGGRVEPGETATQAVIREVHEEAGLEVTKLGPRAYQVEIQHADGSAAQYARCYEVDAWAGTPAVNDPDGLVTAAKFFTLREALYKLTELHYRVTAEPIVSYLQGTVPAGTLFRYVMHAPFNVERL